MEPTSIQKGLLGLLNLLLENFMMSYALSFLNDTYISSSSEKSLTELISNATKTESSVIGECGEAALIKNVEFTKVGVSVLPELVLTTNSMVVSLSLVPFL